MTGVIVYKKDDTIGVRLTGDSEGMGDHCGSVDGVDYFDGGVNSGIMTTVTKVESRKLTFAEEGLIRSLLQPKPAYSTPMASSVPISGLSPAALARMMQLNQRMGVSTTPTASASASSTPRNKLPPSASASPPQLSDPPTAAIRSNSSSSANNDASSPEPALAEEKPPEKKLSRLEILRQKKEAIRKRKLELERKVEETKKEKLQQQQEEEKQEETKPQQESPKPSSSPKTTTATSSPKPSISPKTTTAASPRSLPPPTVIRNTTDTSMGDEAASVKSKESGSLFSKASRSSRDSIEQLWIHELRHESPASADKYDLEDAENLLLEEDEHEMEDAPESTRSLHMEGAAGILRQQQQQHQQHHDGVPPAVTSSKSEDQDAAAPAAIAEEENNGRQAPMRQSSLSRLQQLRQKKRLLEALPASIQTPASVVGKDVVVVEGGTNNLASMAMASAAALGHHGAANGAFPTDRAMAHSDDDEDDDDDSKTTSSGMSHHMEDAAATEDDHGVHDAVPAAFQESVTITAGTANPLPGDAVLVDEQTSTSTTQAASHKRRRMLGLGFLPGMNRQQKRQNTGQGQQQ
eukprot:CAMPEP_0113642022 /NCGR_PEP_ID=MMETSP0017_2-20120614/22075_1 /TAXON_ID=2856 /ORGANISM="Cylindrotheca closterium" /LENGTH=577 /DNA_ID=CAMNT_0000553423 /DNA_START=76 /DNA_END=1809 /DNA_ORIENTATION=+ /assembly_acc=CAM_ASM_000147